MTMAALEGCSISIKIKLEEDSIEPKQMDGAMTAAGRGSGGILFKLMDNQVDQLSPPVSCPFLYNFHVSSSAVSGSTRPPHRQTKVLRPTGRLTDCQSNGVQVPPPQGP
uniref:Uncharacterized protein n=1 Tax=Trieres chinensis TaxID=1514140 RepID=A0A7S2A7E9_TRICV|mmetsp:Transcript_581/g.1219  ORF Transcript_581/g.1219 Transcript_581/m.1219 type:complete len:109 (+) Transcript_581:83-409(+)